MLLTRFSRYRRKGWNFINFPIRIFFLAISFSLFFNVANAQPGAVNGWKFESQREEIAPSHQLDSQVKFRDEPTLLLAGGGREYADGHWFKVVNVSAGEYYLFQVFFKTENVDEPARSVLARILWEDADNKQVGEAEYPAAHGEKSKEQWDIIEEKYQVPKSAVSAKVELVYRWDADGVVRFGGFSFDKSDGYQPRMVRIATIDHRPHDTKSPRENLEQFATLIEKAAIEKADIVCLPEAITQVGTGLNYLEASEPVPGPSTNFLGEVARKNHIYVVAGILERSGNEVFNTAVLLDRSGNLAGVYHKVSLPREEIDGGITPGDSLPVFDTDFGRIGLMICWDVSFPDVAKVLALKGAEVIFMPIAGGNLILARARAIENQVYLVSSSYDMISAVFDQEGNVLVQADDKNPVVVTLVDLNKQKLWWWLGDYKNRIPREMPSLKAVSYTRPY